MTEPLNYSDWTSEQHVAKACELLAEADRIGSPTIGSQAAQRMYDVQQITARAQVHADLAELKKPGAGTVVTAAPAGAPTTPAIAPSAKPTAAKTRARQAGDGTE